MDGENDVCIQITCRFSTDNINKLQYDLNLNNQDDKQHPVIESQFLYTESDAIDKIFHDTIEELNLTRLYLNGYDVTIVKNGKRNVFYEQYDGNATLKTEKSSTTSSTGSTSTAESDGSDDECENESSGLVHNFIRTIFEDLVSVKDVHYLFSIGWTEINELNQLLDLLNGNGLVQCFSMPQLLETIAVGLKNKNEQNNHNILSIVLEQQWIDNATGQPMHKLSTVNFCDFKYGSDKPTIPLEPINIYAQPAPFLPPPNYMFSPPPVPPINFFSPPPIMPTSPDNVFFNNMPRFDNANALLMQQNQRLLKNAEILFSKLNFNDIDDDRRKEIQEWMYLKTECDNYMSTSTIGDLPPPPSYFNNVLPQIASLIPPPMQQQQQSSLLPIIEMDENSTGRDEEETNEDNDSESGSYIDINDQSNNLFQKISDKISNFQEKTDEIVREKSSEYFDNNPKVIFSSGSDCKPPPINAPETLCDEAVDTKISSEQYLATTGRRRSIRENNILSSEELNLIKKAAAATSFEIDSLKEGVESEQQTKLDELRKTLKKSMA